MSKDLSHQSQKGLVRRRKLFHQMPGSRRCKYITQMNRLILWITCTAVVLNWVLFFGKHNRKKRRHTESSETQMLWCRMLRWVYEITEVQTVFVLHLNPKRSILALKSELFLGVMHELVT